MAELQRAPEAWSGGTLLAVERSAERWTRRRRMCGRLLIAAGFPMAYLVVARVGLEAPLVQIVLGLWALALLACFVCATAIAHAEGRLSALPPRAGRRRLFSTD